MSDIQQDTYTLYTLVFVSVLQGNKREIAIVIVFTINILHRIQVSRNKMGKHGCKTINQNKQTRKSRLGLGI
jgi:hypothetical protein